MLRRPVPQMNKILLLRPQTTLFIVRLFFYYVRFCYRHCHTTCRCAVFSLFCKRVRLAYVINAYLLTYLLAQSNA